MNHRRSQLFKVISTILLICIYHLSFSQNDPKSRSILEKTSSINNGYKSIIAEFSVVTSNIKDNETSTEKGKISIKGDKYHLSFMNSEIIFDGKDVYNYQPGSNELTITFPEPTKNENGAFLISNPKDIFKFYTKNFKSQFLKETTIKGKTCFEIDLYPNDLETIYSRIRMHIEKTSYHILDFKIFQKDGIQQTIEFSVFKTNTEIPDSEFGFDQKKYPGIIVNDMRF